MNDRFLFPLGSECYVNSGLDKSPLEQYKIYKSPFNGSRILTNTNNTIPIIDFLSDYKLFQKKYENKENWILKFDGNDLQAHNNLLNIRRCHLNKNNPFLFIEKCKTTFSLMNNYNNFYFLVDLNDYLIFNETQLNQINNIVSSLKHMYFIRPDSIMSSILSIKKHNQLNDIDINVQYQKICQIFSPINLKTINGDDIQTYNHFYRKILKEKLNI